MRCPKCGFHSFDYLDNCKKCGVDLTEQKLRFNFRSHVAPPPAPLPAAPEPEAPVPELPDEAEDETIDFGFDVIEEETLPPLADFGTNTHSVIDLAADSGFTLEEPFTAENENVPDDNLPRLDDRFKF